MSRPQAVHKTPSSSRLLRCSCSTGRNLVVCLDGTANKFDIKTTNVVELLQWLTKSTQEQLTWYNSGIGTVAKVAWSIFSASIRKLFGQIMNEAFALDLSDNIIGAYQWLSENYQDGDRIFLFGFSRGAYQVRALSAMIDKAGLLPKGNNEQVFHAYERYTKWVDENATPDPFAADEIDKEGTAPQEKSHHISNLLCERFKATFSRADVKVHFVGVWDTVASIGLRPRTLPGVETGMGHVCVFRQALALDECRVGFQPVFANGDCEPSETNVKEVWFAGLHSDVGGNNDLTASVRGPSLRWMIYEAVHFGLHVKPDYHPDWLDTIPKLPSFPCKWKILELFPLPRWSYTKHGQTTMMPHLSRPRHIQPKQLIHESVFEYIKNSNREYLPQAVCRDREAWSHKVWEDLPFGLSKGGLDVRSSKVLEYLESAGLSLERDPYLAAKHTLNKLPHPPNYIDAPFDHFHYDIPDRNPSDPSLTVNVTVNQRDRGEPFASYIIPSEPDSEDSVLSTLIRLSSTDFGRLALSEVPGATDKLLSALLQEQRRLKRIPVITTLLKILTRCPRPSQRLKRKDGLHKLEELLKRTSSTRDSLVDLDKVISICVDPLIAGPIHVDDQDLLHVSLIANNQVVASSASRWTTMELSHLVPGKLIDVPNIACVAVSPKWDDTTSEASKIAFATHHPSKVVLWDRLFAQNSAETRVLPDETIKSLAFSPNSLNLDIVAGCVSDSGDGHLRLWRYEGNTLTLMQECRVAHPILVVSPVAPTGDRILALLNGDGRSTIIDWQWRTTTVITRPINGAMTDKIEAAAFSPDGKFLATASADNRIRVLDPSSGMEIMQPRSGHQSSVVALAFSPDGKTIATGSKDKTVRLWNTLNGEANQLAADIPVISVAFSEDSKFLSAGLSGGKCMIWNIGTWLLTRE